MISGHRGAKAYKGYPENSMETFQMLQERIGSIMECDIASTKDGQLILMHDNSLDRTTTLTGTVSQTPYSRISKAFLVDATNEQTIYKVPLFADVLDWAKSTRTILSVDVKRSVPVDEVIRLIREKGAEGNCLLISYTLDQARKVYSMAPEMMQSISIRNEEEYERWKKSGIPANRTVAFTGTRRSPKSLYDLLHKEGIACIFGTLGNIDKQAERQGDKVYRELRDLGVDIFATDRPLECAEALGI